MSESPRYNPLIAQRFRGFLPVVVDIETAGFSADTDAMLEIAGVIIAMDDDGRLFPAESIHFHVEPFEGANLDEAALKFNGIDPHHPFRMATPEDQALGRFFSPIRKAIKASGCNRAVMVAHNAGFDQSFLNAAVARQKIKRNPFHPFSNFDTATLAGMVYGQTVLAKAMAAAGFDWDAKQAHSALYDAEGTAKLYCQMVNAWMDMQQALKDAGIALPQTAFGAAGLMETEDL